jgi:hypothetical protein
MGVGRNWVGPPAIAIRTGTHGKVSISAPWFGECNRGFSPTTLL